jgi:hypothetical protein
MAALSVALSLIVGSRHSARSCEVHAEEQSSVAARDSRPPMLGIGPVVAPGPLAI